MTLSRVHFGSVEYIASILEGIYHSPRHFNKADPFNELIFIVCSLRTTEKQYRASYARLKMAIPKHADILKISPKRLANLIGDAGLGKQKAECIIRCAKKIENEFGRVTLAPLRGMTDFECETFLTSLPRIGLKTARCIMLYSLGRWVFPVDAHCWRIGRRIGWVRNTTSDGQPRRREMDRFQNKVPPHLRYSLHVNCIAFGRETCTAQTPDCRNCPISSACKQIGIKREDLGGVPDVL